MRYVFSVSLVLAMLAGCNQDNCATSPNGTDSSISTPAETPSVPDEPGEPVPPGEPVAPGELVEPVAPTEPIASVEPVVPGEPVEPVDPAGAMKSAEPDESTDPADPAELPKLGESAEPDEPAEGEPAKPAEPAEPTSSAKAKSDKPPSKERKMPEKIVRTEQEWKRLLNPAQYYVLRQKGTERPFVNEFDHHFEPGVYACAACGQELFSSTTKFNSGCGWPAFYAAEAGDRVKLTPDRSHGMVRTEVTCAVCDSHLGHIFDDAPQTPTGQRYCINSVSLKFIPANSRKTAPADEPAESSPQAGVEPSAP